jgi:hypothetical protein
MAESRMVCLVKHGPEGCPGYPHPEGYRGLSEEWATKQTEEGPGKCWTCFGPKDDGSKRELCGYHEDREDKAKERRERIAAQLLAGLIAGGFSSEDPGLIGLALRNADALIVELDK